MSTRSSETPIQGLLVTVFTSILEVFLQCLAGYILAWRGILDKRTQKQINHLNVSLFTPALLFSKVAFFLSPAKLRELWIVPIFFVLVTTISMSVSFTLGLLFRLKKSQRSFAMAAAMFMNSNSLPIALMQSLVISVPGLEWGDDDSRQAMVGRALTYLVLHSTLGMILRWSYGVRLLSQADDPDPEPEPEPCPPVQINESTPLLFEPPQSNIVTEDRNSTGPEPSPRRPLPPRLPLPRRRTTFYQSFPNSPTREQNATLPSSEAASSKSINVTPCTSDAEDSDIEEGQPGPGLPAHHTRKPPSSHPTRPRSLVYRSKRRLKRVWMALMDFMTVPLWAALVSLLVACIRPLQHALDSHMQPVKGAIDAAGKCSIPLTLVVLGGYFYQSPNESEEGGGNASLSTSKSNDTLVENVKSLFHLKAYRHRTTRTKTPANRGETKTVVIAVLSRMVITPLLLVPLMAVSAKYDWHKVLEDPVFIIANVLLISSPPALTLAQITQAASGDAFERLISRTIFWSYCIVTPPATIFYVVVGLLLSKL